MKITSVLCAAATAFLSTAALAVGFTVTPYVQRPAEDAMSVIFFTDEACEATITCAPADGSGAAQTQTAAGVRATALVRNSFSSDFQGTDLGHERQWKHRFRFEGLKSGTPYTYTVTLANGETYSNGFMTAPRSDAPVRFVCYGDPETIPLMGNASDYTTDWTNPKTGAVNQPYLVTRREGFASNIVHMASRKPDAIVIAGDIAAKGGRQQNWDEFWRQNAGGNGVGFNDPAGSVPILATVGNHDLKDCTSNDDYNDGGETALARYLSYFEFNPNGVDFTPEVGPNDRRDRSQLFHREDYGPATFIFLDTNNGRDEDAVQDTCVHLRRNTPGYPSARSPDFNPGSLQYVWLTNNLADAQLHSKFTFVVCHHTPYSVGVHNQPGNDENSRAVRVLTDTMHRYGVDGWLCGHDEIFEHSQLQGKEVLPDGTVRRHTLNVYDLGSAGDGLRSGTVVDNPYEVYRSSANCADGVHYGFLEVSVEKGTHDGKWRCSFQPYYVLIEPDAQGKPSKFELKPHNDLTIVLEDGSIESEPPRPHHEPSAYEKLKEAFDFGGTYALTEDMDCPETKPLVLDAGVKLKLDLNGHRLLVKRSDAIQVYGELEIVNSSDATFYAHHWRGRIVSSKKAVISNNVVTDYASVIHCYAGSKLRMSHGLVISCNDDGMPGHENTHYGAGVYAEGDATVEFSNWAQVRATPCFVLADSARLSVDGTRAKDNGTYSANPYYVEVATADSIWDLIRIRSGNPSVHLYDGKFDGTAHLVTSEPGAKGSLAIHGGKYSFYRTPFVLNGDTRVSVGASVDTTLFELNHNTTGIAPIGEGNYAGNIKIKAGVCGTGNYSAPDLNSFLADPFLEAHVDLTGPIAQPWNKVYTCIVQDKPVSTPYDGLKRAFFRNDSYALASDVSCPSSEWLELAADRNLTLDLAGHKILISNVTDGIRVYGDLTIANSDASADSSGIWNGRIVVADGVSAGGFFNVIHCYDGSTVNLKHGAVLSHPDSNNASGLGRGFRIEDGAVVNVSGHGRVRANHAFRISGDRARLTVDTDQVCSGLKSSDSANNASVFSIATGNSRIRVTKMRADSDMAVLVSDVGASGSLIIDYAQFKSHQCPFQLNGATRVVMRHGVYMNNAASSFPSIAARALGASVLLKFGVALDLSLNPNGCETLLAGCYGKSCRLVTFEPVVSWTDSVFGKTCTKSCEIGGSKPGLFVIVHPK